MMQKSGWRLCRSSVPIGTTQPLEVVAMHDRNACTPHDHLRTFDFWIGINNPYVRAVVRSWGGGFLSQIVGHLETPWGGSVSPIVMDCPGEEVHEFTPRVARHPNLCGGLGEGGEGNQGGTLRWRSRRPLIV